MAKILDGLALASRVRQDLAQKIQKTKAETGLVPGLAYLLVNDDPVSQRYVANKTKACQEVGMLSFVEPFSRSVKEAELLQQIQRLNKRADIHGILVQLPLPPSLNVHRILESIDVKKDVDGFHPYNRGLLFSAHTAIVPCTPKGIVRLLKENGVVLEGKHAVIIGRSLVVGRPLSMLLLNENATVTICHSQTPDLKRFTRDADILVAAVGSPRFVKKDFVSPGVTVVDVGISFEGSRLVGDVDFDEVSKVASAITPVPGGVGPMTVAMLLSNTFDAFQSQLKAPVSVS